MATATATMLALTLSACATGPNEVDQSAAADPAPPDAGEKTTLSSDEQRSATGTFTSVDGQTTGRVVVEVEDMTDDLGVADPIATVKFFELATPYEYLTAGGSLAPRDEDSCFDSGFRAGGGRIVPDENGSATAIMPADAEGNYLHEIVLHLDWTQVDAETEPCMQPIVARAPLTWNN